MIKIISLITLFSVTMVSAYSQKNDLKITDVIQGTWSIEALPNAISSDELDISDLVNFEEELIQKTDSLIVFNNGKFELSSKRTGTVKLSGTGVYLNGIRYKYRIYSADKFSLLRVHSPSLILSYMLRRKNN